MRIAVARTGRNAALALLLLLVLIPVVATALALFFDNARLTQGIRLSSWSDFSLGYAADKYGLLFEDRRLIGSFAKSLLVAATVGATTAWSAMSCAFFLSRLDLGRLSSLRAAGYAAYLTPPVLLVISLSWVSQAVDSSALAILALGLGQCAFLFPLNYALALGHWMSTPYELDRSAASDGARASVRLRLHMAWGSPSFAFLWGLALLTFMLSWSDVLFSRYLLMGFPEHRLLTDVVIEKLRANDLITARGELAAVAMMCFAVAAVAAAGYSVMFQHANRSR